MNILLAVLIIVAVHASLIGMIWWAMKPVHRHISSLLKELKELREDNRALTESLVRVEGKPLIFRKPETKPSEGWYDAKPRLEIKKG